MSDLLLVAGGVPAKSAFNVHVNGNAAANVKSNGKSNVMVKKLHGNLLSVRSITLIDAQGHAAASAKF